MTQTDTTKPVRRGRVRRFGIWLLLSLVLLVFVSGVAVLSVLERTLQVPAWMTARVEQRLNASLAPAAIDLGGLEIEFSRREPPQVKMRDVVLSDTAARPLVQVPQMQASLVGGALLRGQVQLHSVALQGAHFELGRAYDGTLDLELGEVVAPVQAPSLAQMLQQIDSAFEVPALAALESVTIEELELTYRDARAGREWQIWDGLLALDLSQGNVAMQLFFALTGQNGTASEVAISFEKQRGVLTSRMSTSFSDLPAADIATQSPALAFLSVIDAPISGSIRTGVNADGGLEPLNAALEIGNGALRPSDQVPAIRFDRGKAYFRYEPAQDRITLTDVSLDTAALSLQADGQALLRDKVEGWPTSLITQMRLRQLVASPEGVFAEPARFDAGALDMKVTLDPFSVRIGQVQLSDPDGVQYRGSGRFGINDTGWEVDADLQLDQISESGLLGLWPLSLAPKTRDWVARNVIDGQIFDVKGALRLRPDAAPLASLSYEFRDATVRFMKTMPPVQNGFGYSSISDNAFTLVVDSGSVTAPSGGQVDASGTVVRVPNIRQRPATGEITLKTDSSIEAMLSLLDQEPLRILSRAGQSVDLAQGRAQVVTQLELPFVKGTQPQEVKYLVNGVLRDVRSDKLIKNKLLSAAELSLSADTTLLSISGSAALDGVPVQGVWSQPIGPEHKGKSQVEGTLELSQRTVDAFNLGLPAGSVSGTGVADLSLELRRGEAARFRLSSDLNRVGLSIPAIGWSKPRNRTGRLELTGSLGESVAVDKLAFSAPGLSASGGSVALRPGGGLQTLSFDNVKLGGWLDAPVRIEGQGDGQPNRTVLGAGTLDLTASPVLRGGTGTGSGQGAAGPIALELDRLIVSRGITLRSLRGELRQSGGMRGTISALVQGGAPVRVDLRPHANGTAIRVRADDAGQVLRGAGIFEKSRGGSMDLRLTPRASQGQYDGEFVIRNTRLRGTPILAELLSAISVIGLLELLNGDGLVFSRVDGRFRLTPAGVEVTSGSAVGPSLGISMAGVYDFTRSRLDMQGVISPIYMVNAVGQIVSKRGEGLFGFNYTVKGDAKAPTVRVNPLSILTPGIFRELFRSAPPELKN